MKELWQVFEKDIKSENFTRTEYIVYGVIAPLGLIADCLLAEWLESL